MQPFEFIVIAGSALLSALLALLWLREPPKAMQIAGQVEPDKVLLFEDGILSHASDAALTAFDLEANAHEWEDLRDKLLARFPGFPPRPGIAPDGSLTISSAPTQPPGEAVLTMRGNTAHVAIHDLPEDVPPLEAPERHELDILRMVNDRALHPAWLTDENDKVVWHNPFYDALYERAKSAKPNPDTPLFETLNIENMDASQRVELKLDQDATRWFDIVASSSENGVLYQASPVDAVVRAEEAQRNFVQTLAKTFAQLSIGLAIFDKQRQLALFNPALIDLTSLSAEFLSGRPTMLSFFDHLRESRAMPEPKNYTTWRQEITKLIADADHGRYQEVWSLETGQTYRISGRPHPDGATAFLIEDISAEISVTRNFRAELELSQCLLDTVEDAMVGFSRTGALTFSNVAFREMWEIDPESSFAEFTIFDAIKVWDAKLDTAIDWRPVEEFVLGVGDRKSWELDISLNTTSQIKCDVLPVVSGTTLIRFRKIAQQDAALSEPQPLVE